MVFRGIFLLFILTFVLGFAQDTSGYLEKSKNFFRAYKDLLVSQDNMKRQQLQNIWQNTETKSDNDLYQELEAFGSQLPYSQKPLLDNLINKLKNFGDANREMFSQMVDRLSPDAKPIGQQIMEINNNQDVSYQDGMERIQKIIRQSPSNVQDELEDLVKKFKEINDKTMEQAATAITQEIKESENWCTGCYSLLGINDRDFLNMCCPSDNTENTACMNRCMFLARVESHGLNRRTGMSSCYGCVIKCTSQTGLMGGNDCSYTYLSMQSRMGII